jgi:hypothetical protein
MVMMRRRSCEAGADRPVQEMTDLTSIRQPMAPRRHIFLSAHSGVAALFIRYLGLALMRKGGRFAAMSAIRSRSGQAEAAARKGTGLERDIFSTPLLFLHLGPKRAFALCYRIKTGARAGGQT